MKLVETIYGRHSKYTIYRSSDHLWRTHFTIYRDGKSWYSCSDLAHAVAYIRRHDG